MRRIVIAAVFLLGGSQAAWAGIYSTAEPLSGPDITESAVRALPMDLFTHLYDLRRGVRRDPAAPLQPGEVEMNDATKALRKSYLSKAEALESKVKSGMATVEDKVNLSAYLIWLQKPGE